MYHTYHGESGNQMFYSAALHPAYHSETRTIAQESCEAPAPGWYQDDRYKPAKTSTYQASPPAMMDFDPTLFLAPSRLPTQFINTSEQVMDIMHEAFEKTAGTPLPDNLVITVCPQHVLKEHHQRSGGTWSPGILGFCINHEGDGPSEVFVKEDNLDRLLLTLGHEIGHALSCTLPDAHDEEAKAFAFSLAWMDTIMLGNIGGLARAVNPRPAVNGLHNVAFDFVLNTIREGVQPLELFHRLVRGEASVKRAPQPIPI